YNDVLKEDPQNLSAIDGVGALLYNMAATPFNPDKFLESKSYHEKHIQIKPNDADPYYWVGVIDWTLAYHANQTARSDYNHANPGKQVKDNQPLPEKVRGDFTAKESQTVDEAIDYLKKAMARKPDYDDAMAYLNLVYRQKADMATSEAERDDLIKQADDLMDQVKQIKQKKGMSQGS
ncbi:MAG: hypothetical protein ACRD5L_10245, partial [Bryobacteraceae bacterium]